MISPASYVVDRIFRLTNQFPFKKSGDNSSKRLTVSGPPIEMENSSSSMSSDDDSSHTDSQSHELGNGEQTDETHQKNVEC